MKGILTIICVILAYLFCYTIQNNSIFIDVSEITNTTCTFSNINIFDKYAVPTTKGIRLKINYNLTVAVNNESRQLSFFKSYSDYNEDLLLINHTVPCFLFHDNVLFTYPDHVCDNKNRCTAEQCYQLGLPLIIVGLIFDYTM